VINRCTKKFVFILTATFCVFIFGCGLPIITDLLPICRCKKDVAEVAESLRLYSESVKPIKAGGSCRLRWYDSNAKLSEQNCNITLRFYPPDRLYLRADSLIGEVMSLGINPQEFWFQIKPQPISRYWWGRWEQLSGKTCLDRQWVNPGNLLEVLSGVYVDSNWSLSDESNRNVLTSLDPAGKPTKRVYVNCCDHLTRKIEHFDDAGNVVVTAELSNYKISADGVSVPGHINIINHNLNNMQAQITLRNITLFRPSAKQFNAVFSRPEPKGFEHVLELDDNCKFIEQ